MKKYKVNVNGTAYEVEIEEMTGAPTVAAAPVAASAAAPATSGAGERITSPMPGNILAVNGADGAGSHEDGERDHGSSGRQGDFRGRGQGRRRGVRRAAVHHPVMEGT